MGKTSIEWTDRSINPIRFGKGHYCQKISPGCANCYASRMQVRFGNPEFGGHKPGATGGDVWLDRTKLDEVRRLRKPSRIFWCDMTDLFGDWVLDGWIDLCFATMALTPHHTHQVLTKRPQRMMDYFAKLQSVCDGWEAELRQKHNRPEAVFTPTNLLNLRWLEATKLGGPKSGYVAGGPAIDSETPWPLPNVWLGTSCEDQKRADERIPHLLRCQAAVRFLSCEPLLGPIRLAHPDFGFPSFNGGLQWVIVGGESGPGARPCGTNWIRSIVDQCHTASVPCFVKQLGANAHATPLNDAAAGTDCRMRLDDRKGGDWTEWSEDLRVREFPRGKAVPA